MKLTVKQLKHIIKEVVEDKSGYKANSPQAAVTATEALQLGILKQYQLDLFHNDVRDYTFYKARLPQGVWVYTDEPLPRKSMLVALDSAEEEALAFDGASWEPIGPRLDDNVEDEFVAYRKWLGTE